MPSCTEEDVEAFIGRLQEFDSLFYKSLARNDHQWADVKHSHQSGVLIPRDALHFFGLEQLPAHNDRRQLDVAWWYQGQQKTRDDWEHAGGYRATRINYYCEGNRADRPEAHLTCVYNPYFEELNDGALLVIGRVQDDGAYEAIIIDPSREDLLRQVIDATAIPESPSWGVLEGEETARYDIPPPVVDLLRAAAEEIYEVAGDLPTTQQTNDAVWDLVKAHPEHIRGNVQCRGLAQAARPFDTALEHAPGNLVRWLHEKLEFRLLRFIEREHYAPLICDELRHRSDGYPTGWGALTETIAASLDPIVTVSKSLTQSRRTRAGHSFEHDIARLLERVGLPFERQAGPEKIDFLIRGTEQRIPLSAKTSTRERWKQLPEGAFFITLDRQIAPEKLRRIVKRDVTIIVPESDRREITHYGDSDAVVGYRDFLDALQ